MNSFNIILYILITILSLILAIYFSIIACSYNAVNESSLARYLRDNDLEEAPKCIERTVKYGKSLVRTIFTITVFFLIIFTVFVIYFLYIQLNILGIIIGIFLCTYIYYVLIERLGPYISSRSKWKVLNSQAKIIYTIYKLLSPIRSLFKFITKLPYAVRKKEPPTLKPQLSREKLLDHVELNRQNKVLDDEEAYYIENVINFHNAYAKDIMTPRTDLVAVEVNSDLNTIKETIKEEGFSRMPVYRTDLDNILGILYVKDLFQYKPDMDSVEPLLRPAYFTFEYKPIAQLFKEMRYGKRSVAIVLNEYGGFEGVVTTEDLVEQIVGPIIDEYDKEPEDEIIQISSHEYLVQGNTSIVNFNRMLDVEIEAEDFDTVAGYIIEQIDRFPEEDESFEIDDLYFKILKASKNRIEKILCEI